jgi:hypothetical protein
MAEFDLKMRIGHFPRSIEKTYGLRTIGKLLSLLEPELMRIDDPYWCPIPSAHPVNEANLE